MATQNWSKHQDQPTPPTPVLEEAHTLIFGQRQEDYGTPEENLANIANYWEIYLRSRGLLNEDNDGLFFYDVCRMMELLKIARLGHDPHAHDSSVDVCGYEALVDRVIRGE